MVFRLSVSIAQQPTILEHLPSVIEQNTPVKETLSHRRK